jgi:CubicO group peptidase (beta-lactamase class C family)
MAATCVLMLADRGEIDLDAPVADLWPEFGANGKAGVLVRHVMSHSAGLSGFEPAITATDLYDWDRVCELLAAQAPWWEPGARSGYHAITQGYLQGELVRRVTGRSLGTFFRDEVAGPLGADFHIGLPASEDHRVADLVPPDLSAALGTGAIQPDTLAARTLLSCPLDATEPRTRAWRGAEIPAAGGTGNARSVARVHSALACGGEVDGVRLMSADGVERILEEQISGTDGVLGVPMRFGMGFGLMSDLIPLSPNKRSFFWGGWGGSLAVIDLDAEVSVAYVMNRMGDGLAGDVRGALVALAALGVATTLDA